jgi:hypothetical protein
MATHGGVLLLRNEELCFIDASVAQRVLRGAVVTLVPGTPLGLTVYDGRVICVFELGSSRGELVVCDVGGELVALAGLRVVETGTFEAADTGGVRAPSGVAQPLDVALEIEAWAQQFWSRRRQAGDSA